MENLHDFGLGSDFMDMTPKARVRTHTHAHTHTHKVGILKAEKISTQQRKQSKE